MTRAEFEKRVKALVGAERGWKSAAAERLGVSERAMRDALSGRVGPKVEKALISAETGVGEVSPDGWGPLTLQAGRWWLGIPETRSKDRRVMGEVVLTHMFTPVFIVHVVARENAEIREVYKDMLKNHREKESGSCTKAELKRSADELEQMRRLTVSFEKNAKWVEKASSRDREAKLLQEALERAQERIFELMVDAEECAARDELLAAHEGNPYQSQGETMAALAAAVRSGSDSDMKKEVLSLEREETDLMNEHRQHMIAAERDGATWIDVKRAFERGEKRGRVKAMLGWSFKGSMHIDADISRLVIARHSNARKSSHKTTARGAQRGHVEIGLDGSVSSADAAVMLGLTGSEMRRFVEEGVPAVTEKTDGRAKRTRVFMRDAIGWMVDEGARYLNAGHVKDQSTSEVGRSGV